MTGDLPDYEKKIVIVTIPGDYPALMEIDHRKIKGVDLLSPTVAGCLPASIEHIVRMNHTQILGVALKSPTFAQCVPTSIENTAIAYNAGTDRFKVDIEAMTVGTIDVNVIDKAARLLGHVTVDNFPSTYDVNDRWARQLGLVDLSRVLGAALAHSNPVITRLTSGTAFIDPRDRNWTITENLARSWTLGSSDIPDLVDKAARLLGKIYGNQDVLQQRATTKELIVQIQHQGTEVNPTAIRALTSSDVVTIADLTKIGTPWTVQATASGNNTVKTPTGGKKLRVKLVDVWNSGTATITVYLRFAAAGTARFTKTLAANTGFIINLIGTNWEGAADELLIVNLSADGTVNVTCMGDEV